MDNRAGEMAVLVRVVEAGSFSAAARLLRMTPSTVPKLVGRIEQRLGVRLVERSTRRFALTKEGQLYFERSQALLAQLEEAEREIAVGCSRPHGVVRVNASVSFGTRGLEPLLPAFWRAYPEVVIDLSLSDEVVDLYLDRTDVALGRLAPSGLLARKIGVARRIIVGSPAYLARRGTPKTPEDLLSHDCPPYLYVVEPFGCAEGAGIGQPFWTSGDTAYSNLCSVPCGITIYDSSGECVILCQLPVNTGVTDSMHADTPELRIDPNPLAIGAPLKITTQRDGPVELTLTDVRGRVVYQGLFTSNTGVISTAQLSAGLHLLSARWKDGHTRAQRLQVQ